MARTKSIDDVYKQRLRLLSRTGDPARKARIREISDRYQQNMWNTDRVKKRIERAVLNGAGQSRMYKVEANIARNYMFGRDEYMKPAPTANNQAKALANAVRIAAGTVG